MAGRLAGWAAGWLAASSLCGDFSLLMMSDGVTVSWLFSLVWEGKERRLRLRGDTDTD